MKRVVITGIGAVSPIGITKEKITESLKLGRSAVCISEAYKQCGFRSQVWAPITEELPPIDRRVARFAGKGDTLRLGYHAMKFAVADSGLTGKDVESVDTGIIVGTGGPSTIDQCDAWDIVRNSNGPKKIGPFSVVPTMSSGLAALLATEFKIKGVGFSVVSACATSAHCIGEAALKIATGMQTVMFAGGADDCHPSKACGFDAMGALVSSYNNEMTASSASRPFDIGRNGFVDGAGAGVLVLEEFEHAKKRGAHIYAELVGYGATSDGYHMTEPSGEGAVRCMLMALQGIGGIPVGSVQYLNAHGTSTQKGDLMEMTAVATVFSADTVPQISSTKAITGHALGGAGALEAIYSILALEGKFVPVSAHIERLDPEIEALSTVAPRIARETVQASLSSVMSNSFGFGGTNATLIFRKVES